MKKFLYILAVLFVTTSQGLWAQKPQTREISTEAAVSKGSLVRIVGASRRLNIKSWDQSKVKVTVQIAHDSSFNSNSTEELMEALGISIKSFSNRVDIMANRTLRTNSAEVVTVLGYSNKKKKTVPPAAEQRAADMAYADLARTNTTVPQGFVAGQQVYVASGNTLTSVANIVSLDIMIPNGSKLDVDNQYGDVTIAMNVEDAKLNISNGSLDMQDVKKLELTGKYCNANFGNVEIAEVEFQNGTLHALSINDLDLDSKYSTIEYDKGRDIYIRSQADNITIDEISKVEGRKTYGSVRVDMLNGNFDLDGNNVDIKIRNINPNVEMIKINNKYGDVRLPVRGLKNYFVDFTGYNSAVFTPFAKTIVKEDEGKPGENNSRTKEELLEIASAGDYYRSSSSLTGELAPKRFTGSVGDVNGKHTRFQLTCHSCTVDFK
jgi:hypothetical protein